MSGKLNMSLEAQFHRQIKSLKWCSKRMQGEVMGAFRAIVGRDVEDVFKVHAKLEEQQKLSFVQGRLAAGFANDVAAHERTIEAMSKDNAALKGQLQNVLDERDSLALQLRQAQQGAKQSRSRSLLETCTSTSIGFVGSLCITWGAVAAIANVGTASLVATLGCTVWSLARGYSVRRFFEARR